MKKLLSALCMMVTGVAYAQTIPVSDFENWTITNYDDLPLPWHTSNMNSVSAGGTATLKKVAGFGSSPNAVRLETHVSGSNIDMGYFTNTEGDPTVGEGGTPYTQKPNSIKGYFRYNLPANDTAVLMITFKENGSILATNTIKIKGTGSQSTFAPFSYPISAPGSPDTVVVVACSSNIVSLSGISNGSWIEFDSLEFDGPGINQQLPNNGFELWQSNSLHIPQDCSVDGDVTRTTDKYAGMYAAKLVTTDDGTGSPYTGDIYVTMPYASTSPDTLTGYYKYTAGAPGDNAQIIVLFFKNGTPVGTTIIGSLAASSTYTKFTVPFQATQAPDELYMIFASSDFINGAIGSTFLLDDVAIKQGPVSVNNTAHKKADITVYPNPAKDVVTIRADKHEDLTAKLFDNTGKLLAQQVFSKDKQSINFSLQNIPAGMYHVVLYTTQGSIYTVKTVSKQ